MGIQQSIIALSFLVTLKFMNFNRGYADILTQQLFQSQDKSTGGLNPEPCPICARSLGQEVR